MVWSQSDNSVVSLRNFYFANSEGERVADVCSGQQLAECAAQGGGLFIAEGSSMERDGQILGPGCYAVETCASTPYDDVRDQIARWACRNEGALEIAQAVTIVAGMIAIAPALAPQILAGAGLATVTAFWVCDTSDNGALRPGGYGDLDPFCVATELLLGGAFGPLGAGGNGLVRRAAMSCVWGCCRGRNRHDRSHHVRRRRQND